jgi:cytochrome c-type biogenesis protein CcmH
LSSSDQSAVYTFSSVGEESRFNLLVGEVRCVVCQGQSIADSNAPLANDLRNKIYYMVLGKKSDEDIKNYLVKRYGEFILLRPRVHSSTLLLWFFPLIGVVVFVLLLRRFFKRVR